jgi:hypothetical protein
MVRLAEFVLHHRRLVMLFWLVMFVVGGAAAGQTAERLTVDFSLPGQPGYETEKPILQYDFSPTWTISCDLQGPLFRHCSSVASEPVIGPDAPIVLARY